MNTSRFVGLLRFDGAIELLAAPALPTFLTAA
jgi:hypothetical protein